MLFRRPKHTVESVARTLVEGFRDGSIVLDPPADPVPALSVRDGAVSVPGGGELIRREYVAPGGRVLHTEYLTADQTQADPLLRLVAELAAARARLKELEPATGPRAEG